MRLILMGTGPFAVPMLHQLVPTDHEVRALVTRPIASAGRRKSPANPMRDAATAAGLEIVSPEDVNAPEFIQWLREQRADLLVVCDYGQILSDDCLRTARLGGINLHGSLLPQFRGAAPIQWALLQGEERTGVSVIHMTPALDAGPILVQHSTPIGSDETAEQLERRLAALGADAVVRAIEILSEWDGVSPIGEPQDPNHASRAPRLKKNAGHLHWNRPARDLRNQIRALTPWPGSYTHFVDSRGQSQRLIVHEAEVAPSSASAEPGTILVASGEQWVIACGAGALALRCVQPAGKKRMTAAEFLRGYALTSGATLS